MAMADRAAELELLQRYRRDRCELLNFLLSASIYRKVVLPPGAVSLEDIDLDQVSIDYVLECARKNGVLELSEAIKKYHDEMNLPPMAGSGFNQTFFLATNVDSSGPPPARVPPSVPIQSSASGLLQKSFSFMSTPSRQPSVDELIDDFEDEEDGDATSHIVRRQLNDASDLVIDLPLFKTGLSEDDLRETAYEMLLASVGAAGGLLMPPAKEKKEEKKSRIVRKLTGRKSEKYKPQPSREPGLAGLLENIRTQMEISEAMDQITRAGLLNASAGRVGKRMDTLLVPLELLCTVSRVDFPDRKAYLRWEKRQVNMLEEGLLNYPSIHLDPTDYRASELRTLIAKLEEAEGLPSPAGPAQHAESLKAMRGVTLGLAERASRGDQTGEVCHWGDGYHLNVRLYERLLCSIFDILDEGKLIEEVDEIMELLKSTWRILGVTQTVHDLCYTWVLFRQFVLTGEEGLLQHASLQMKRIAADGQRSPHERFYMKSLRSRRTDNDCAQQELTFVESVLGPIKQWVEKRMEDYHVNFADASRMEALVTLAMVAGRLLADEKDQTGITRMTSAAEMAAVAKQAEDYIASSVRASFERTLKGVDAKCESEHEHPLALLAEDVQSLAKKDATLYAPILSPWHPHAVPFSATLFHNLYQKELKPFLDGVSVLTDDVASVLPAADSLEQYLLGLIMSASTERDTNFFKEQLKPFQVEEISSTLIMRWVNMQLSRVSEWVDRTLHQEKWEPLSNQQRHGGSIVEVFRIMEETIDQFFNLKLPMRFPILKSLLSGLDNALQLYSNKTVNQLGIKEDLIPPPPGLTRYGKETTMKTTFTKKRVADPRLPDEKRGSQLNLLTVSRLCVRLNTLHYILNQVNAIEDNIKNLWALRRPQDSLANGMENSPDGTRGMAANKASNGISTAFESTRKVINGGVDKICEFLGMKVIFWDLREPFIDGLYKNGVADARIDQVIGSLDSVLGQICEVIVEPLRDRVVLALLQASLDGMVRVLIDGGPTRYFSQADANVLEDDLKGLKDFFMADGDGLPRGVVENMSARVKQIVDLYRLDTRFVIESLKRASEQMMIGASPQKDVKTANDEYTLLRILCHKMDTDASQYLKKQYKLPKSSS